VCIVVESFTKVESMLQIGQLSSIEVHSDEWRMAEVKLE